MDTKQLCTKKSLGFTSLSRGTGKLEPYEINMPLFISLPFRLQLKCIHFDL